MKSIAVSVLKWAVRVGVSFWIAAIFFHSPGVNGYNRAEFSEMVYGQAWRPFVTRALFPAMVRVVSQGIPSSFDSAVQKSELGSRVLSTWYVEKELKWHPPFLREYFVAFFLSAACLVLLSLTMERLWAAMFSPSTPHGYAFSILGLLGLPTCFKYYSYIYDFPTLVLYTTCLLLMARRRWGWYFFVFGLCCLSKETAILLVIVFAIYFIRCANSERGMYWASIATQVLIWAATRTGLAYVFRENPGGTVELHLVDHNLRLLTEPSPLEALFVWGMLIVLYVHEFHRKPWLLRVASGMIAPLLALCLFFGYLDELRDYYEVYVPVVALIGYSVCAMAGYRIETRAPTNASSVRRIRAAGDR